MPAICTVRRSRSFPNESETTDRGAELEDFLSSRSGVTDLSMEKQETTGERKGVDREKSKKQREKVEAVAAEEEEEREEEEEEEEDHWKDASPLTPISSPSKRQARPVEKVEKNTLPSRYEEEIDADSRFYPATDKILPDEEAVTPTVETIGMEKESAAIYEVPDVVTSVEPVAPKVKLKEEEEIPKTRADEISRSPLEEETVELAATSSLQRKKSDRERRKSLRRYDSFESGPQASTETLDRSEGSSEKTSKKRLRAEREEDGGVKRRSKRAAERERRSKDGETSKRRSREERKSLKEQECIERVTQYLSKHSSLAFMEPYTYSTFDEDSSLLRSLDDERRRRMEREAAERAKLSPVDVIIESGAKEEIAEKLLDSKSEKIAEERSSVVSTTTTTPLIEDNELTRVVRSSADSIESRVSETPGKVRENLERSLKPSISDTEVAKATKRPSSLRKRKGTASSESSKESPLEESKKEVRIRETVQEIFFEDSSDQLTMLLPEVQLVKARIITAEEAAARFEATDGGTKIDVRSPPEVTTVIRQEDVKIVTARTPLPGKLSSSELELPTLAKSTSENALIEDGSITDDNKVSERNIKPEILLDLSKVSEIVDDAVVVTDKDKDVIDKKVLSRTGSEGSKRPFPPTKGKLIDQRASKVSVLSLPSEPEPELTTLPEHVAVDRKEDGKEPKAEKGEPREDVDRTETSSKDVAGEGRKPVVESSKGADVVKEEKVKDKKESRERDYEEIPRQQEEHPLLEEEVPVGQANDDTLISKEHSLEYQSQTLESQPEPVVPAPVPVTPRNFFKSVPESWNREVYEDSFEEVQRSYKETQYSPREKREVETQTEQETKSTQCSPDQSVASSAEIFETAGFHVALRFYQSPKREVQTQTQGESKSVQCSLDDLTYPDSRKDSRGLGASTESLGRSDRSQIQESKSVQCIPEDISSDASKSLDDDKEEFFSRRKEVEVQTYQESKAIQCTDEEFPPYELRRLERSPSRPASLTPARKLEGSATSPRKFATVVFVEGRTTMTVTHRDHDGNVAWSNHWGPERLVEIYREPKTSLGLSIVGGKVDLHNGSSSKSQNICGIFIKNVLPNSPAGRTGELKIGDRIIEVDGVDLRNSTHERAVEVIQAAGNPVCLLVQSLVHLNTEHESNAQDGRNKNRLSGVAPGTPTASFRHKPSPVSPARSITPEVIQGGIEDGDRTPSRSDFKRQSTRSTDGAGPSVRRSSMKKSVRKKAPSPPSNPGILREVSEEREDHAPPAQKPTVSKKYSSEESSEEEDIRELEGNVYTKAGMEISRKSAGNVKRSKEEIEADPEQEDEFGYTQMKVQKKYHNLGHKVLMVKIEKERGGLGISLAGHKDRNRMAVFICGIHPKGSAHKVGELLVGDEILEVNGMVLKGRCHLNASALIKGMAGTCFKIIVIRKTKGIDDIAVKPLAQFPPILDEATSLLKKAEGVVKLTVCNPNQSKIGKDGEEIKTEADVKPVGKDTTIEFQKEKDKGIGFTIAGGSDTPMSGVFILEVFPDGAAGKDGRLQAGDQILDMCQESFKAIEHDKAHAAVLKATGTIVMVVHRSDKPPEEVEVELQKKSGKGAGLCLTGFKSGKGAYVSDLLPGGSALESGKICKGTSPLSNDRVLRAELSTSITKKPAGELSTGNVDTSVI
ncbi:hypothetical protein KPH14_003668 [Odynerus spinipes]|uniref:PDZ domain-containing protein n=1 Tax=Odynerus spinipes TaxID=1348599 RepID=A0AAD9RXN7_9HYME|nr:hypothetical protein KPH14_003668 [Odynerus spinipes]